MMDEDTATRFISSLVKSIQALCNGYIDFSSSIEVVGHIHLNIDRNKKLNYILTEEVSKSLSEDATLFASHSYHSKQPSCISTKNSDNAPKQNRRKSQHVPRVDDSEHLTLSISSRSTDLPGVQSDVRSSSFSRLNAANDDSHSENLGASRNSSLLPVLDVKPEATQPSATHRDVLDRRRKSTSPSYESPAAKRKPGFSNIKNFSPAVQLSDHSFDVEIKEEPVDEPNVYFGENSSHGVAEKDMHTPDFSNVVMESLDQVSQLEGSSLLSGNNVMQVRQSQPFPVMLHPAHANAMPTTAPSGSSAESVPGPSISGEGMGKRVVKVKKATTSQAGTPIYIVQSKPAPSRKIPGTVASALAASRAAPRGKGYTKRALASKKMAKDFVCKSGYREYTLEDVNEAIELIHGGMPVIDAALNYGIPRATLFNRSRDGCKTHTGRCSEVFGRTHTAQNLKKRTKNMQYTKESVEKAIEAVHSGMPVIDASILYRIPRASLFIRSAKGCPSHPGRCATVFSDGKLRRTKAPKLKVRKAATGGDLLTSPYGHFQVVPNASEKVAIKTEPGVTEPSETTSSASAEDNMQQEQASASASDPTGETEGASTSESNTGIIIVKVERLSPTDF